MKKNMGIAVAVVLGLLTYGSSAMAQEQLQEYDLGTVNVTAVGYTKSNLKTPADVEVYTGKELQKTGASDVAQALKYKTGNYYSNMGPDGQSWITGSSQVNLRGVDGGTLVLLNGVPMSFNNVSHLDMMNMDNIERVEVVKNGGAVLYGSEAFGGVINVITKKKVENGIHVGIGNQGQRNYSLSFGADKLGIIMSRKYYGSTGNVTEALGTKTISGTKVPYYIGFGKSRKDSINVNYQFNDNLGMSYLYNKKEYSIKYNDKSENELQHFDYDDQEHAINIHYEDDNGWDATGYYNLRKIENNDYYLVRPSNLEWEESTHNQYGINGKKVWKNKKDTIVLGLSGKRETYENDNQKFKTFGNSSSELKDKAHYGTYGLNEYSLLGSYERAFDDSWSGIISFREDLVRSNAGDYNEFLPQFQLNKLLNNESSLYVNVGKSFRMPTFRNLYYSSSVVTPNPDLKPEKGWNYELGYKYNSGKDKAKIALFRIDLSDQIVGLKDNATGKIYQTNAAGYKNQGLEASFTHEINNKLSYNVGAMWVNPQRRYKDGQAWQRTLGRYQLNGGVQYDNKDFDAAINLSYWGNRVKNSVSSETVKAIEIDGNLLSSSLHLGYKVNKVMYCSFDVDNLFNRKDIANVVETSNNNLYYTMGRTFMLSVDYKF